MKQSFPICQYFHTKNRNSVGIMKIEPDDDDVHLDKMAKYMQVELEEMKDKHENPKELMDFFKLYKRFLRERNVKIDWDNIEHPKGKIVNYDELTECSEENKVLLNKLAVLKLNGGLGTTMGMVGPKSAIKVKNGKNFIDLVYTQLDALNKKYGTEVPLILMNSFNTDERTKKIIKKYSDIKTIKQSVFPRISAENLMPISGEEMWYPPGHGDVFITLINSGMLDELIAEGKEYLFISNIDNLAATVDLKILQYFASEDLDFCMELTEKTRADIKGGTLINYNGILTLLEIAQVPSNKKSEFTSVRKFKVFNTNSIWIRLKALKEIDIDKFDLDIIQNKKVVNGESVIQLETAMGAAIKNFPSNCGILVPRTRFLPIKTCSDLFLVESNVFEEKNGYLSYNPNKLTKSNPTVKLIGKNFSKITEYEEAFESIPDIVDLEILTVVGDVKFGKNVVLKGIVVIMSPDGSSIQIPEGSVLEDKVLLGNLSTADV